jgi:hypothetical protein
MVPRAGLEPAQTKVRRILSPLRLPNSAIPAQLLFATYYVEAAPGFEPGIRILQTLALPLGYAANSLSCSLSYCHYFSRAAQKAFLMYHKIAILQLYFKQKIKKQIFLSFCIPYTQSNKPLLRPKVKRVYLFLYGNPTYSNIRSRTCANPFF